MTISKTAQNKKAIEQAIQAHFNDGVSLDDTCQALFTHGIKVLAFQDTIKSVGIAKGWILTPEKIKLKVIDHIKDKSITHFLDVLNLAKNLDMPQLSIVEKQQAIIDYSGIEKSKVKEPAKFKQLHNSGHFGKIAEWILENPEFTPQEIHTSGLIDAPNKDAYYDEMLAYREFFYTLYELTHEVESK